jgi:crossover junction endodeoxyribonuclease RuvC
MIIMGIDPGSRKAGYAIITKQGRKLEYLHSGVLRYEQEKEFISRLGTIYRSIGELCKQYQPQEIAFESLIYVKSVTSLAKLAQARGAMIAACSEFSETKLFEYAPNLIKSTVTGHGHSSKEGTGKVLELLYGKLEFASHDESDALAIATCHALNGGLNKAPPSKGRSLSQVFKNYKRTEL